MVSKKGSKSKTNAKKTETPVETPVEAAPVVEKVASKKAVKKQAGGAKKASAAPKKAAAKQAGGAKKTAAPKKAAPKKAAPKKAAPKKATQEGGEEGVEMTKSGKVVRSFKVQLPGSEEYTGRFTGSTPYQAANKALSKYFRTEDNPKAVITFTIRESTRGSKHNTYTYEGHRIKLETPVSYTIGDGNTITKHHKNQLKKIKKADVENKESL